MYIQSTDFTRASEVIAFSAYATEDILYSDNEVMDFPSVRSNIGSAYDPSSNRFTCPVSGQYMFAGTCLTDSDNRAELVIAKNGNGIASAYSEVNNDAMSSILIFDECDEGEYVEIKCGPNFGGCRCNSNEFIASTTFSGMLVGLII